MLPEKIFEESWFVPDLLWYSCDSMMVIDEHRRFWPSIRRWSGCSAGNPRSSPEKPSAVSSSPAGTCRDALSMQTLGNARA